MVLEDGSQDHRFNNDVLARGGFPVVRPESALRPEEVQQKGHILARTPLVALHAGRLLVFYRRSSIVVLVFVYEGMIGWITGWVDEWV